MVLIPRYHYLKLSGTTNAAHDEAQPGTTHLGYCAPALSPAGTTVYITVISPTRGILVGLDATTLKPRFRVVLKDPVNGRPAMVSTSSSASPTVGPDGDVYYGVLENPITSHDFRGWLLHYNATLTRIKIPGSFGWDNTPSVLPARAVPGYHGTSPYLLVSKYNNYLGVGPHGDGHNQVAVLDPRSSQKDPYANVRTRRPSRPFCRPSSSPGHPLEHGTNGASTPPWSTPPTTR